MKFAYHFSCGKFAMSLYRVNFPNFSSILVKNFDALVLSCAIDALVFQEWLNVFFLKFLQIYVNL